MKMLLIPNFRFSRKILSNNICLYNVSLLKGNHSNTVKSHFMLHARCNSSLERKSVRCKIAIVTGGANGIGYHIARNLLKAGARVVVIGDVSIEDCEVAACKLNERFGENKAFFQPCDVSSKADMEKLFRCVMTKFGKIDIVVNNAGILADNEVEKQIGTNITGVVYGTLLGFEHMGAHKGGAGGVVVNVSSVFGLQPWPPFPLHTGTKHFVVGFTRALGNEMFHDLAKVKTIALCPGITVTNSLMRARARTLPGFETIGEQVDKSILSYPVQEACEVGQHLIKLLEDGQNGSAWVAEGGELYQVNFYDKKLMKPPERAQGSNDCDMSDCVPKKGNIAAPETKKSEQKQAATEGQKRDSKLRSRFAKKWQKAKIQDSVKSDEGKKTDSIKNEPIESGGKLSQVVVGESRKVPETAKRGPEKKAKPAKREAVVGQTGKVPETSTKSVEKKVSPEKTIKSKDDKNEKQNTHKKKDCSSEKADKKQSSEPKNTQTIVGQAAKAPETSKKSEEGTVAPEKTTKSKDDKKEEQNIHKKKDRSSEKVDKKQSSEPNKKNAPGKKKEEHSKKEDDPCKKKEDPCKKKDSNKQIESSSKKEDKKADDPCKKNEDPCKKKEDPCKQDDPCKKKDDPCKKKDDPCKKKEDPCKKKEDPCKKKEDPCKKKEDPCKKKEDPCKKKEDPCKKKEDPCKKKEDPCKKKEDPCKKKEDSGKKKENPSKKKDDPSKKKEDACEKKEDPCKKKEDPCKKKEDPCKKDDPCKKKEDPCEKKEDPCQKDDPCKKKKDPCEKKEDPCKKKDDPCKKKDPCEKYKSKTKDCGKYELKENPNKNSEKLKNAESGDAPKEA